MGSTPLETAASPELSLPELRDVEQQLRRLEKQSNWMWVMATVLLVALGTALVSLRTLPDPSDPKVTDTPFLLIIGLSGLVLLFSLYMLIKQHQLQVVRGQLFQALLRAESLRSRLSGLSSLFEGLAQVGVHFELEAALQTLADHVRSSLGAEQCSIMLLDPESRELQCVAVSGSDADFVRNARVRLGDGVAGWVAQNDEPVVLTPDVVERRFPFAYKPLRGIISGLCVPLSLPDRVIGVLSINRLQRGPDFTTEDARLVSVFARHIAIATRRMKDREVSLRSMRDHEDQLRHYHKMEALGRLAGGVAHDFNNQLTVILAYSGKLARELPEKASSREHAEQVSDAAERAARLTRKLLTFSRNRAADPRVVDVNATVGAMGDVLRRVIGDGVALEQRLASDLARVRIDPNDLEQVMTDLVVNARDSMQDGIVTIETALVRLDAREASAQVGARAGDYVRITVRDTGRGMDADTRTMAFEPFFTTKPDGSGLGLATAYGIVRQSGGFITLESDLGKGTTIRIHLPATSAEAAPDLARRPTAAAANGTGRILVVEDDESVLRLVRDMLAAAGYEVLTAAWTGQAILVVESSEQPIDLVLTDVGLPGDSGGELARWVEKNRPGVPVLFMSGYPDEDLARWGMSFDADFLRKPFTGPELLAKVRSMRERTTRRSPATGARPVLTEAEESAELPRAA
jgi:signal transduction histidine kinase/ActR/RegA family two-component response regulator